MHEKKMLKLLHREDLVKSADLLPPEVKTRGIRETYCLYVSVSIRLRSLCIAPRARISWEEQAGTLSSPSKEPPPLQLAAEAQFGGFLINLSCQMLYDKMVKIGGRSGGGGVKVHFAKQTNSKSLDFTNYPSLWLSQPLFFPPISVWTDKIR